MALSTLGTEARETDRFDALFHSLYPRLFALSYRLVGDHGESEDIVQEAFIKLSQAAVLAQPEEEIAAWLRKVCLNQGINSIRDRQRAQERLEREGRMQVAEATVDGPASAALEKEEQRQVRQTLALLPDRQRDCLLLRHSGYAYVEIAATLGIAVGSVGVLLARAERAFRQSYQELDYDKSDDRVS